jgi:hypothetical protein
MIEYFVRRLVNIRLSDRQSEGVCGRGEGYSDLGPSDRLGPQTISATLFPSGGLSVSSTH